ncbi:Ecdysteroid 22-kinase [Operophtera brumata]|uniref:Ecdysteroid 22-kinase n=1 Tax=Operophtera brumata TaxID=104452 RepID=A0A0L7KXI3_OPEBR|nr:Ecdysteroid 22-kinase [Operophtera brumata]
MDIDVKLRGLLHNVAKEQNLHNYDLKVTPISSEGASFTSFLYTATISSANNADLNLFIKVASMGAKIREDVTLNIYNIEHFVYSDLKKSYRELEESHQLPKTFRFNFPEYYGANTILLEETLVLENLTVKGFVGHDRFKSIDWQYASTTITELAKFHALSIAYQRNYPDKFRHFTEAYTSDWINENSVATIWKTAFETSIAVVRDENKAKVKRFLDKIDLAAIKKLYKPLRCKVLAHTDFRPSNLMHRTRDDGSLEVVVVDFQTLQVGCPVLDLLYLIFTGTDKEFRDRYYQRVVDHYYTQLSEAMKRLSLNPKEIYTREDFDFELNEKLPFGLVIAAFTLLLVTLEPENAPQVDKDMDLSSFAVRKTGALFPERMNGVVDDYVKWGVLID